MTFVKGSKVVSKSFPIGIVTMAQKYGTLEALKEGLDDELKELEKFTQNYT